MFLYIDTGNPKAIKVEIRDKGKVISELSAENEYGSQTLLSLIVKILTKTKIKVKDLQAIKVETGPGSFTGLRVGIAVANALAFALNIPVNGKKIETELQY